MSHGNVAKKRYKSIDESGHFKASCQGSTTGHQNRSPATRNDVCSIPCHISDRNPSTNTPGMCHTIRVAAAAIQPTAGCNSMRFNWRADVRQIGRTASSASLCIGRCSSRSRGRRIHRWFLGRNFAGARGCRLRLSTFGGAEIVRVGPPAGCAQRRQQNQQEQYAPSAALGLLGFKEGIQAGERLFPQRFHTRLILIGLRCARLIQSQQR